MTGLGYGLGLGLGFRSSASSRHNSDWFPPFNVSPQMILPSTDSAQLITTADIPTQRPELKRTMSMFQSSDDPVLPIEDFIEPPGVPEPTTPYEPLELSLDWEAYGINPTTTESPTLPTSSTFQSLHPLPPLPTLPSLQVTSSSSSSTVVAVRPSKASTTKGTKRRGSDLKQSTGQKSAKQSCETYRIKIKDYGWFKLPHGYIPVRNQDLI